MVARFFQTKNEFFSTDIDEHRRKSFSPKLFRIVLGVFPGLENHEKRSKNTISDRKTSDKSPKTIEKIGTRNPSQMIGRPYIR